MDFLSSLVAKAGEGLQKAKSAVIGAPPSTVSDAYPRPTMGARRRKKTKKAGRRHRRKTGRRV